MQFKNALNAEVDLVGELDVSKTHLKGLLMALREEHSGCIAGFGWWVGGECVGLLLAFLKC